METPLLCTYYYLYKHNTYIIMYLRIHNKCELEPRVQRNIRVYYVCQKDQIN